MFKRKPDTGALEEMLREAAQQRALERAQLEFDRQNQMQQMANLTTQLGTGNFNTISTTAITPTYTTTTYTGNSTAWPSGTLSYFNIPNFVPIDPDKYDSRNDAANRVMQLRDSFGWGDLKPSIRGKRFNHYGLEWRMI